jgi:hypothetical protein
MLKLDRRTLAQLLQNNQQAIFVFERMLGDVGGTLPSTIEEANALAGQALALAQTQGTLLSLVAEALAQLQGAPAPLPQIEPDDTAPRAHLGTIASQNADQVEITGGAVDGTTIGQTSAADAKFKKLAASDQITSTVADGTAPLIVTSKTKVANLYADRAATADTAGNLGAATAYPTNATDLASCIALANALKAANTAKGV